MVILFNMIVKKVKMKNLYIVMIVFMTHMAYGMEDKKLTKLRDFFVPRELNSAIKELPQELQKVIAFKSVNDRPLWYERKRFKHGSCVNSARLNKDEKWLITASSDKTACIWNIATSKELLKVQHDNRVYSAHLNKDETWLVTASGDHTACMWDTKTGGQLLTVQHEIGRAHV